jgi:hypothetical protein
MQWHRSLLNFSAKVNKRHVHTEEARGLVQSKKLKGCLITCAATAAKNHLALHGTWVIFCSDQISVRKGNKKNAPRKMYFCNSCSSIYEQVPRTGSSRFFFWEVPAGEKIIFHLPA